MELCLFPPPKGVDSGGKIRASNIRELKARGGVRILMRLHALRVPRGLKLGRPVSEGGGWRVAGDCCGFVCLFAVDQNIFRAFLCEMVFSSQSNIPYVID